jgi:hypothetical protein
MPSNFLNRRDRLEVTQTAEDFDPPPDLEMATGCATGKVFGWNGCKESSYRSGHSSVGGRKGLSKGESTRPAPTRR